MLPPLRLKRSDGLERKEGYYRPESSVEHTRSDEHYYLALQNFFRRRARKSQSRKTVTSSLMPMVMR